MTKIVGLTGGIGSGKTTVAKMFQELGVPIYIADLEARTITNQPETLQLIEQQFGSTVIQNGQLNREAMAELVFSNPEKLQQLNAIIHPLVANHFKVWLNENENALFVMKEVAILFETKGHLNCDFVITVTAPIELKRQRLKTRDHSSDDQIKQRIDSQWSDKQRIELSDFIIENTTIKATSQQVNKIYKNISQSLQ
jgi:dephospho-CoA kinase